MVVLLWLLSGLALLYLWLRGHWFARVLAFLILVPIGAFGGAAGWIGAGIETGVDPATGKPVWWGRGLLVWGIRRDTCLAG